jgi:hypothetical protein
MRKWCGLSRVWVVKGVGCQGCQLSRIIILKISWIINLSTDDLHIFRVNDLIFSVTNRKWFIIFLGDFGFNLFVLIPLHNHDVKPHYQHFSLHWASQSHGLLINLQFPCHLQRFVNGCLKWSPWLPFKLALGAIKWKTYCACQSVSHKNRGLVWKQQQ